MKRFPGRTGTRSQALQTLADFESVRWRAAQQGYVLTRQKRLLGAMYALTPLNGQTTILYDLGEVRAVLDRSSDNLRSHQRDQGDEGVDREARDAFEPIASPEDHTRFARFAASHQNLWSKLLHWLRHRWMSARKEQVE